MQTQTCAWLENTTLVNIGVKKGTEDTDFSTTLNVTEIYLGIDKTADEMLARVREIRPELSVSLHLLRRTPGMRKR